MLLVQVPAYHHSKGVGAAANSEMSNGVNSKIAGLVDFLMMWIEKWWQLGCLCQIRTFAPDEQCDKDMFATWRYILIHPGWIGLDTTRSIGKQETYAKLHLTPLSEAWYISLANRWALIHGRTNSVWSAGSSSWWGFFALNISQMAYFGGWTCSMRTRQESHWQIQGSMSTHDTSSWWHCVSQLIHVEVDSSVAS